MRSYSILAVVAVIAAALASAGFAGSGRTGPADTSGFDGSGTPARIVAIWHEGAVRGPGRLRRVPCATQAAGDPSACFVAAR